MGLWAPAEAPVFDVRVWLGPLRRLSPFPVLPALDPDKLAQVIRRCPAGKATGADGISFAELKDWPTGLLGELCHFFRLVERLGAWPATAPPNVVCLLPKGGTSDPADRRPIVLLSCLYRLWAACRALPFRRWLRANNILVAGEACGPDV